MIVKYEMKNSSNHNLRNNNTDFVLTKPKTNFKKRKALPILPLQFGMICQNV